MTQDRTVEQVLRAHALHLEFQPICDLGSGNVVGFEALMRGPTGPLGSPEALLATAQAEGVLEELDRLARFTALFEIARIETDPRLGLFMNFEACVDLERFGFELAILDEMAPGVPLVLEITQRAARRDPATLAGAVETARSFDWLVSLDDLGPGRTPPTLLPLLKPEFVKLDLSVVQHPGCGAAAPILDAVHAYVADSGATLIAEGIETGSHLRTARSLGATWGQGWFLGRPGPLPRSATGWARSWPSHLGDHSARASS